MKKTLREVFYEKCVKEGRVDAVTAAIVIEADLSDKELKALIKKTDTQTGMNVYEELKKQL